MEDRRVQIIEERHKRADGLVDLSHPIEDGMITYKGLPGPVICDFLSREASRDVYAEGTEFQIGRIDMVSNTGTYIDSPFHRFPHGHDLADLRLGQFADLDALLVRAEGRAIDRAAFAAHEVRDRAVLVHTGWDAHWRTDQYFEGHPFLTKADIPIVEHLPVRGMGTFPVRAFAVLDA